MVCAYGMSLHRGAGKKQKFLDTVKWPYVPKGQEQGKLVKRRNLSTLLDKLHCPKQISKQINKRLVFLSKRCAYPTRSSSKDSGRATGRADRDCRIHVHPSS